MISVRGLIQPIAPSMMSTRPDLVDSISAAHSIWCGTIFRPSRSAMSESISPSVPISLPSLMVVIGMSPFIATLSTPGSIVLIAPLAAGAAVPATAGAAVAAVDTVVAGAAGAVVAAAAAGAEVGAAAAGALVGAAAAGALVGAAAAGAEVGAAAGAELQALSSDPAAAVPASASVSRRNCRRETRVVWAAFDTSMLLLPPRSIGKGTSGVQRSLLRRQRQPRPDHRSARPASSGHSVRLSCPRAFPSHYATWGTRGQSASGVGRGPRAGLTPATPNRTIAQNGLAILVGAGAMVNRDPRQLAGSPDPFGPVARAS